MVNIFTLTSQLHDVASVDDATRGFLSTLSCEYNFIGEDFSSFCPDEFNLIFVRTGGTEGIFKDVLSKMSILPDKFLLLTSGQSNSLAASMEIMSYLNNNGLSGEILHGDTEYINSRISALEQVASARKRLSSMRLGVIGTPSDWLISSSVDYAAVKSNLGPALIDIEMSELLDVYHTIDSGADCTELLRKAEEKNLKDSAIDALRLYKALQVIVERYRLDGFTIRCFDLLTEIKNTGCLALALFNSQGKIATCEGDIPAMLSMAISYALTGCCGFQANPSHINPVTGEMLFAHCTIPFNMVNSYELDTHFESGIGVGIRGYSTPGPVTIFKTAGDASRHFAQEGMLTECQDKPNLCRTQQVIKLNDPSAINYFLKNPIGNHHVIIPGQHKDIIDELFQ